MIDDPSPQNVSSCFGQHVDKTKQALPDRYPTGDAHFLIVPLAAFCFQTRGDKPSSLLNRTDDGLGLTSRYRLTAGAVGGQELRTSGSRHGVRCGAVPLFLSPLLRRPLPLNNQLMEGARLGIVLSDLPPWARWDFVVGG